MPVTTDEQEYEEIVKMIHEAEERKEAMDGIGEMFPTTTWHRSSHVR